MKYLGNIKVTLLKERREYKELFRPLSESEYADLRESIRNGGIVNDLIVDRDGDGYVILSGHHRKMVAEELESTRCRAPWRRRRRKSWRRS